MSSNELHIKELYANKVQLDIQVDQLQKKLDPILAKYPKYFMILNPGDYPLVTQLEKEIGDLDTKRVALDWQLIHALKGTYFQIDDNTIICENGESGEEYIVERKRY